MPSRRERLAALFESIHVRMIAAAPFVQSAGVRDFAAAKRQLHELAVHVLEARDVDVKNEVMSTHHLPDRVIGKDGKSYPATPAAATVVH